MMTIISFQKDKKSKLDDEEDNPWTISQTKPNPYEDAVNLKITNQKMMRRLDNITDKLINQVEAKLPKNLEVCDNLGKSERKMSCSQKTDLYRLLFILQACYS